VLLEFVSANPTGPLHVGHGRGAAVGDTLARLLRAVGHPVHTEYYVNDAGNQMKILGRSVLLRYRELSGDRIDFPEDHYQGDYITELAQELKNDANGDTLLELDEEDAVLAASRYACQRILEGIQSDLALFNVYYDEYFSEKTLHDGGMIVRTIDDLHNHDRIERKDGALWFVMGDDEDEKDRVLKKSTGEWTYFAADAAYHQDKLQRGFDILVDIWGADHHGYVPRVKAVIESLGYPSDALKVLLVQFVALLREGQKHAMSTRAAQFVTLREVLEEVGSDAARFMFLTKRCDSHLDFDLELAKKQSRDNPVYYVQYAHARIASIFRIAGERGIDANIKDPDLEALSLPEEQNIVKHLAYYPDMLTETAEALEPHRITFYLMDLAEMFHAYYHDNKVLTEDARVKKARLYLVEAVRLVVANGLSVLGVNAPERM
jgi:arginyl-tRNA synthetase